MSRFAAPPANYARLPKLVGLRPETDAQAAANGARLLVADRLAPADRQGASVRIGFTAARPGLPPMCPGLAPREVHAAAKRGDLPLSSCGPWGQTWPIAALQTLAASLR